MRFCDFFISYKIGLKNIPGAIPFTELPFYRKLFASVFLALVIVGAILYVIEKPTALCVSIILTIMWVVAFCIINSTKSNLEIMLRDYYVPNSKKRINMTIDILQNYGIDIQNSESIDLLIKEAQSAQSQCDYLTFLKKPIKTLSAIIIPIIVFVAQQIGSSIDQNEMIIIAVQAIVVIILIFTLETIVKDVFYRDYNKYNELVYDLRQIKIFYSNQISTPMPQ